jgi:hypothetical protein
MDLSSLKKIDASFYDFVGNETDVLIRLHNTNTVENALNIVDEGFRFVSSLDYTTDTLSYRVNEEIDYFIVKRRFYGDYTMIIHSGLALMQRYLEKMRAAKVFEPKEMIFSKMTDEINEDDRHIHILNRQFVKGFYDQKLKAGFLSPYFDPYSDNPEFDTNLEALVKMYREQGRL